MAIQFYEDDSKDGWDFFQFCDHRGSHDVELVYRQINMYGGDQ